MREPTSYFSPHILDLVANAPTGTPTPKYLDALRQWLFLNWFRIENYTRILFLVTAFIPASPPRAPATGCHAGSTRAAPGDLLDLSVHVDDRALAAQRDHVNGGLDELLE